VRSAFGVAPYGRQHPERTGAAVTDAHAAPEDDVVDEAAPTGALADLDAILAVLEVRRRPGVFAVCTLDEVPDADVEAVVVEDEGLTVVLPLADAEELRLSWGFEAAWLTVDVRTALDGVGLTAALARVLADAGLPCNVLAGFHHDHLLVPADRADEALAAIEGLRRE
jgi:hypothetical protein